MNPLFQPPVRAWFQSRFPGPTAAQEAGWPVIARGQSALLFAPTGTGKTLAAFLWCIDRLMFRPAPAAANRCRVLYISPIKALAVDVERNLRVPLQGIAETAAALGVEHHVPSIAVRTGDTPTAERARFARHPCDILITTPESIYLLLTSNARETLRSIETVVVDEIHALVATKRGAHLAVSLERLEHLCGRPIQRIGLSATQRPLEEVAQFLGGSNEGGFRPVSIVNASAPRRLDLRIEVPIDDMARIDVPPSGPEQASIRSSIWTAIHPKLVELVRAHRSTILFVNSRRLAERISAAMNDLAGEVLVRAHHGSVAASQRQEMETLLKQGALRAIAATSSLELGIDMGAVDLVIQIEAPPSVASGMQRIGRANHHVGGVSRAVIFPKYRADLAACAAITRSMRDGHVESTRYIRNPLDVLAQQIVAMVAMEEWDRGALLEVVRQASPFHDLGDDAFEGTLDMLAGRYPSAEFTEWKPRITWDRTSGRLTARQGSRGIAVVNGGTIPDRGLFGVFLAGATRGARVGELDEEMVFESRVGDAIFLGATTWRIEEITPQRVVVSPAPGVAGKMPFWHGDNPGRPAEFGEAIGRMIRELRSLPKPAAFARLMEDHALDANAAENLLRYLDDQAAATGSVPGDQDIVIERCRDELGDWRVCVLSPFGTRVHMPWAMAVTAKIRAELGIDVESMWSDDGFVLRLPGNEERFEQTAFVPNAAEFRELVLGQLSATSLFAAKFREAASRALLLPKHKPGMRVPLWQQRKRASDLLASASRYSTFPIMLEAYRECVREAFDLDSAERILRGVESGAIRVTTLESSKPSPFASALLFSYVANYIYDGDAPLAERRLLALSIDQSQLHDILGSTDLRELLDPQAIEEVESNLQCLTPEFHARHADALHDLLLRLGDLSEQEISARSAAHRDALASLRASHRAIAIAISGQERFIPVEYAARYRDALGVLLPRATPAAFLDSFADPSGDLVRRYSRTHGPFTLEELLARYPIPAGDAESALRRFHASGKILEGEFRPGGIHREWCDAEVLRQIRRKSLARLRREVVPAEPAAYARMLTRWHGVTSPRKGTEALLDAIESLQGAALLASELDRDILPARVRDYRPEDLDAVLAAGDAVWLGRERVGDRDGRISLYLIDALPRLLPPPTPVDGPSDRMRRILDFLRTQGASFFSSIHTACGGGFPKETSDALWDLLWAGQVTNDAISPLRSWLAGHQPQHVTASERRAAPPGSPEFLRRIRSKAEQSGPAQGRWSLVSNRAGQSASPAEAGVALAQQLLARHGIVMRETAINEGIAGGYPSLYPVLRTMEESGWVRRGMFVAGLGAAQFALPAAVDMLRGMRKLPDKPESAVLAASDPANPYGSVLPWPADGGLPRSAGASVVLVNGVPACYFRRRNPSIRVFLPDDEPEREHHARELARRLATVAIQRRTLREGLLIETINDEPASDHMLGRYLEEAGFVRTSAGYQMRRISEPRD